MYESTCDSAADKVQRHSEVAVFSRKNTLCSRRNVCSQCGLQQLGTALQLLVFGGSNKLGWEMVKHETIPKSLEISLTSLERRR